MASKSKTEGTLARLELSAFQIDDAALFTVYLGSRLLASGMAKLVWKSPKEVQLDDGLTFQVTSTIDDPVIVGKFKNQRRVKVSGFLEVPVSEVDSLDLRTGTLRLRTDTEH